MTSNKFRLFMSRTLMVVLILSAMLTPSAWAQTYQTLHDFTGGLDGNDYMWVTGQSNWYSSGLVLDSSGNLYGVAASGGAFNNGVVYELSENSDTTWTETVLYNFTGGTDGGFPFGGLIFDGAGALYGTATGGGSGKCSNRYTSGCGVVFKLAPNGDGSWTEAVLHSFAGTGDGAQPEARLTFDAAGNLYGSAVAGGLNRCAAFNDGFDNGCPVIFKLTPNSDGSWTETMIHRFTGLYDGCGEPSPLLFDAVGNLYGTTSNCGGRGGVGVAFKMTPNSNGTWTESILHSFPATNTGYWVMSHTGLVFDSAGNLYGTSFWLPNFGGGTVFKLAPTSSGPWKLTVVHGFGTANEYHPVGGVIFDQAGNLYGTATSGGTYGDGVVFKLVPSGKGWTYSVLYNFSNTPLSSPFSLILDSAGNLYGTANYSDTAAGGVFEITP